MEEKKGLRDMKRKIQTNQQVVKKPKLTPQSYSSPKDSEASDKRQYKHTYPPKSKRIDKSRKPRMELDHVHGISVPDSIEKNGRSEQGNGEELEETVCKAKEGNNSTKGSGLTPNNVVDKMTTQSNFLRGESKEDGGDDKHEKERERQVEQISQSKGMPTFNWTCLYNATPDEDDNASEPKDDALKEGSGDDVNDDEEGKKEGDEESKDGATKSKNEQENDTGSCNEVQESTSKAITYVKDDYALVKTQSKPFQRVWTEEDEKTLLEAIGSYKAIHGYEPNNNDLFNIIKGKISFEPNIGQIRNKTRSLKRMKKKTRQRIFEDTLAEKSLLCSSENVWGVKKMISTTAQSSKRKEMLKDTDIASMVMTLFQGNEGDELMKLEMSIRKVAQLIASGLPTKWKDMIKAQVNQYLVGLNNRRSKLELFLKMMEVETGEHDDNDTEGSRL